MTSPGEPAGLARLSRPLTAIDMRIPRMYVVKRKGGSAEPS
jgi:hypothetical protein